MTEEDFLMEFMYTLSQYYRCKFNLNDNGTNFKYKVIYFDEYNNPINEYKNAELSNKDMIENNSFLYLSSKDNIISTNFSNTDTTAMIKDIKSLNPNIDQEFQLYVLIDTTYSDVSIYIDERIELDMDVLGYIDPNITVNLVRDGKLEVKTHLELPETLTNVLTCKNPRCITSVEQGAKQRFYLADKEKKIYRCSYCDVEHENK